MRCTPRTVTEREEGWLSGHRDKEVTGVEAGDKAKDYVQANIFLDLLNENWNATKMKANTTHKWQHRHIKRRNAEREVTELCSKLVDEMNERGLVYGTVAHHGRLLEALSALHATHRKRLLEASSAVHSGSAPREVKRQRRRCQQLTLTECTDAMAKGKVVLVWWEGNKCRATITHINKDGTFKVQYEHETRTATVDKCYA